ncbi:MAG: nucleoside triphosphate pyrophosphohydrolase, partial [Oscillibacter sp.]|nr:nucleoside triphosphate pyrophosphohydrolase [Oscillibacter sp.]
ELREALEAGGAPGVREEAGDVLFITVSILRMHGIDPEDALHRTCDKFERRFRGVEEGADRPLSEYTEAGLVALWKKAKETEHHTQEDSKT